MGRRARNKQADPLPIDDSGNASKKLAQRKGSRPKVKPLPPPSRKRKQYGSLADSADEDGTEGPRKKAKEGPVVDFGKKKNKAVGSGRTAGNGKKAVLWDDVEDEAS